jgi:hypothetical protein
VAGAAVPPSSARAASTSATVSPGAAISAIGAPTATVVPGPTSVRTSTPAPSAGTSTAALSVSTVAIASPSANSACSASNHSDSVAWSVFAATSGIRSSRAISGPLDLTPDLGQPGGDLLALGDRGPL